MKLTVKYVPNTGVSWKGLTAEIGYSEGRFTSLGLEKGQTELSDEQVAWLTKHEDEIIKVCEAQTLMYKNWRTISSEERDERFKLYQTKVNKGHDLLELFCKECKITDL